MAVLGRKRSGGPRTPAGKASSSRNALKTGISVDYWIDPGEQAEYEALVQSLVKEYQPQTATVQLLIERLAKQEVKLRRLERMENALHERARITAEHVARQQQEAEHSLASYLPATPAGRELALRVAVQEAMPDLERLSLLLSQQSLLDRNVSRLIAEIRRRTLEDRIAAANAVVMAEMSSEMSFQDEGAAARPARPALVRQAAIEDATVRRTDDQ